MSSPWRSALLRRPREELSRRVGGVVVVEGSAGIALSVATSDMTWGSTGGSTDQQSDGDGEEMLDVEQAMIGQPDGDHCLD